MNIVTQYAIYNISKPMYGFLPNAARYVFNSAAAVISIIVLSNQLHSTWGVGKKGNDKQMKFEF